MELSGDEALEFFSAFAKIKRALQALCDTGLDYLKLGQTSPTLSGGEAQRVKLVNHLVAGWREARVDVRSLKGEGRKAHGAAGSNQELLDLSDTAHFPPRTSNLFILEDP